MAAALVVFDQSDAVHHSRSMNGASDASLARSSHLARFVFALLFLALFLCGFGSPRLTDRDIAPTIRLSVGQLQAIAEAQQQPELTAKAWLLYDVDAERVLYEQNADVALPPASLTKLMTALLVLERSNLATEVTVQAADLIDGASMGLVEGETLTVEQLLYGLLIPSGNDAAMALARHTWGSVERFVQRMNERANELGLEQTQFANPHGFDARDHESSAADLLTLTRALLEYPIFRTIVAQPRAEVAGHLLRSTNHLLETFAGADGIKTGTTPAAGQCLVASVTRNGHQIVLILLGSRDRYADARQLYAAYEANFAWEGGSSNALSVLNRIYDNDGKLWFLHPEGQTPQLLQERWGSLPLQAYRQLREPTEDVVWRAGMQVGIIEWRLGTQVIDSQLLVLN